MTRLPTTSTLLDDTNLIGLPTSRGRSAHELGVLAALRAMAPRRALTPLEAERLAERQANRLLRLARVTAPPTPTNLIAELPRVIVRTDHNLPTSAGSFWINGRWLIVINADEPRQRQRFSLAHEYAHVLQHRHRALLYVDRPGISAEDQAEQAADAFAAALLMPERQVRRAWADDVRTLADLSELFDVSPRAMLHRLEHLELRTDRLTERAA